MSGILINVFIKEQHWLYRHNYELNQTQYSTILHTFTYPEMYVDTGRRYKLNLNHGLMTGIELLSRTLNALHRVHAVPSTYVFIPMLYNIVIMMSVLNVTNLMKSTHARIYMIQNAPGVSIMFVLFLFTSVSKQHLPHKKEHE